MEIQLTIVINFIFTKDTEEEHVMHSIGDYINLHFIMMQRKLLMNSLGHFVRNIEIIQKYQ